MCVIKYDVEERYYNYNNYYLLTKDEEKTVLKSVELFNPSNMKKLSLFINEPNLIPYGKDNEFYEITNTNLGVNINSEIILDGKTVKVLKVMACNQAWLDKYYFVPIHEYESLGEKIPTTNTSTPQSPIQVESNTINTLNYNEIQEGNSRRYLANCRNCCIDCLIVLGVILIIFLWILSKIL